MLVMIIYFYIVKFGLKGHLYPPCSNCMILSFFVILDDYRKSSADV